MTKEERITLAHGSGGGLSAKLINDTIRPFINNNNMSTDDAATVNLSGKLAFTSDSYVVSPIFFPGGDIGRLAVCGTVNDLTTAGATPKFLSLSFIIEEGFLVSDFERILQSIKEGTEEAGVHVVTGDTKVVGKNACDGIFINTAGIGTIDENVSLSTKNIKKGDKIIVSGTVGDHGITIMSCRHELGFSGNLFSDVAPLKDMVAAALKICPQISAMRDPTRGGIATALNEFSLACGYKIVIDEESVPINDSVRGACAMLGLDPYYVANEGKMLFVCPADKTQDVLLAIKKENYGTNAAIIGEVTEEGVGVSLRTPLGALRRLDTVFGELLPRIC